MTFVCSMPGCPATTAGCPRCMTGSFWQPQPAGNPPIYYPMYVHPIGCICPPTSEKTCENPMCPRKLPRM